LVASIRVDKNADGRIGEEEVKEVSNKQTLFAVLGLVLEWCERKIMLADWWLESGAGAT